MEYNGEIGDFVKSRRNGKIYWIIDIDYKNRIYVLEYMIKAGKGFEEDEKRTVAFDFDELKGNFDEEKNHKGEIKCKEYF